MTDADVLRMIVEAAPNARLFDVGNDSPVWAIHHIRKNTGNLNRDQALCGVTYDGPAIFASGAVAMIELVQKKYGGKVGSRTYKFRLCKRCSKIFLKHPEKLNL